MTRFLKLATLVLSEDVNGRIQSSPTETYEMKKGIPGASGSSGPQSRTVRNRLVSTSSHGVAKAVN